MSNPHPCIDVYEKLVAWLSEVTPEALGAADAYDLAVAADELREFATSGRQESAINAVRRLGRLVSALPPNDRRIGSDYLKQIRDSIRTVSPQDTSQPTEVNHNHVVRMEQDTGTDVLVAAALMNPELHWVNLLLRDATLCRTGEHAPLPSHLFTRGLLGSEGGKEIRVAAISFSRMGPTDCAAVVSAALSTFRPRLVAMSGVCAGRQGYVRIGDLVVPSLSLTHDTGKAGPDSKFAHEPQIAAASESVISFLKRVCDSVLDEVEKSIKAQPVRLRRPKVSFEVIASGSSVVNRIGEIDKIAERLNRKVTALDMECYSFFRAVELVAPTLPAFAVKGVMDYGYSKTDTSKSVAAYWAAAFLLESARRYMEEFVL